MYWCIPGCEDLTHWLLVYGNPDLKIYNYVVKFFLLLAIQTSKGSVCTFQLDNCYLNQKLTEYPHTRYTHRETSRGHKHIITTRIET